MGADVSLPEGPKPRTPKLPKPSPTLMFLPILDEKMRSSDHKEKVLPQPQRRTMKSILQFLGDERTYLFGRCSETSRAMYQLVLAFMASDH
jgi:hypothetical protein